MKLFIINPDNGQLVAAKDWRNEEQPKRANFVVIENNDGTRFMMSKKRIADGARMTFDDAKKKAAEAEIDGFSGFNLGSLDNWASVYEARFIEDDMDLDDVLKLIGGDDLFNWCWVDRAFQSNSYGAWLFLGGNGALTSGNGRVTTAYARVFRAF